MSGYIVHKPVNLKDVQAKHKRGIDNVSQLAESHIFQRKYDGVSGVIIIAPNEQKSLTRVGTQIKTLHHVERFLSNRMNSKLVKGEGFVVLGEVWKQGTSQHTINGLTMRTEASPDLKLAAFDIIPLADFQRGVCDIPFADRYALLAQFFQTTEADDPVFLAATYNPGTYGDPMTLAAELVAEGGYDGGILRDPAGLWRVGGGSTGEIIKVKDAATETCDLRVIGTTPGRGKYLGLVGGLLCHYEGGRKVTVSGMTDKQRADWAHDPSLIVGQIVEVASLGKTNTGMLREPRMKSIRHDKAKADYE